jgi:hypothetical protein
MKETKMTATKKQLRDARADLEHYLENVFGMGVAHSRRQRDGSIRVYLFQFYGVDRVTEVRWDPRRPFVVSFYKQVWIETGHGNTGGHQEDERTEDQFLADHLVSTLSATV